MYLMYSEHNSVGDGELATYTETSASRGILRGSFQVESGNFSFAGFLDLMTMVVTSLQNSF